MKGKIALISVIFFAVFALMYPAVSQAELKEGMSQGEFALWLVKEVGALSKLGPAATDQNAIDFLVSLGIAPKEGWNKNGTVDKAFLISLLGDDAGDVSNLTFDELVARVRDYIQNAISDRALNSFRATSSASGSTPA